MKKTNGGFPSLAARRTAWLWGGRGPGPAGCTAADMPRPEGPPRKGTSGLSREDTDTVSEQSQRPEESLANKSIALLERTPCGGFQC